MGIASASQFHVYFTLGSTSLVGAFSAITNLRVELRLKLYVLQLVLVVWLSVIFISDPGWVELEMAGL